MRRIALYSDVHGNTVAYAAVLDDIDAKGVTERYCLGDVVGLGPRPEEAVNALRRSGDVAVRGNYDRAIGAHLAHPGSEFLTPQEALDGAESYGFTIENTSAESGALLLGLPDRLEVEEQGVRILLCHGAPASASIMIPRDLPGPELVAAIRDAGADAVCAGHIHVPFHRSIPTVDGVVHWVNAGSVGRPRDGDSRAAWVELAIGQRQEVVEHASADTSCRRVGKTDVWLGAAVHRIAYDVDAVVKDMVRLGLPATLAAGLKVGHEEYDASEVRASRTYSVAPSFVEPGSPVLVCGHTRDVCDCMFAERTAAYEALARILRGDIAEVAAAVRRLRIVMREFRVNRFIDEAAILRAFDGADRALRTVGGRAQFEQERNRLIGRPGAFDPFENVLSPDESTYAAGDAAEHAQIIEDSYDEAGYETPCVGDGVCSPGDIAAELLFMAHCLRAASVGDARALARASAFFEAHLSGWATLFATVLGGQAAEPVMRYAGLALDKHLACEAVVLRRRGTPAGRVG